MKRKHHSKHLPVLRKIIGGSTALFLLVGGIAYVPAFAEDAPPTEEPVAEAEVAAEEVPSEETAEPEPQSEEVPPTEEATPEPAPEATETPVATEEATETPAVETTEATTSSPEASAIACENGEVVDGACVCAEGFVLEGGACVLSATPTPTPTATANLEATKEVTATKSEDSSVENIVVKLLSPDADHQVAIVKIEEENDGDITDYVLNPTDLTTFTYAAVADGTYRFTITYQISKSDGSDVIEKTMTVEQVVTGIIDPMDGPSVLACSAGAANIDWNTYNPADVVAALNDPNGSWMNNASINTLSSVGMIIRYTYLKQTSDVLPYHFYLEIPKNVGFNTSNLTNSTQWANMGVTDISSEVLPSGATKYTFSVTTGTTGTFTFTVGGVTFDVPTIKAEATGNIALDFKMYSDSSAIGSGCDTVATVSAPFSSSGIYISGADGNNQIVKNLQNSDLLNGIYNVSSPKEFDTTNHTMQFTQTLTIAKDANSLAKDSVTFTIPVPAGYSIKEDSIQVKLNSDGATYTGTADSHISVSGSNIVVTIPKADAPNLLTNAAYSNPNAGTISYTLTKSYVEANDTVPFNFAGESASGAGPITTSYSSGPSVTGPTLVWNYTNPTNDSFVARNGRNSGNFSMMQGRSQSAFKVWLASTANAGWVNGNQAVTSRDVTYDFSNATTVGFKIEGTSADHKVGADTTVEVCYTDNTCQALNVVDGVLKAQNFNSSKTVKSVIFHYKTIVGAGEADINGLTNGIAPLEWKMTSPISGTQSDISVPDGLVVTSVDNNSGVVEERGSFVFKAPYQESTSKLTVDNLSTVDADNNGEMDYWHYVGKVQSQQFAHTTLTISEIENAAGTTIQYNSATSSKALSLLGKIETDTKISIEYCLRDTTTGTETCGLTQTINANSTTAVSGVDATHVVSQLSITPLEKTSCLEEEGCTVKNINISFHYLDKVPAKVYDGANAATISDNDKFGLSAQLVGTPAGAFAENNSTDSGTTANYKNPQENIKFDLNTMNYSAELGARVDGTYDKPLAGVSVSAGENLRPYNGVTITLDKSNTDTATLLALTGGIKLGLSSANATSSTEDKYPITGTYTYTACTKATQAACDAGTFDSACSEARTYSFTGGNGTIIKLAGLKDDEYVTSFSIETHVFDSIGSNNDGLYGFELMPKDNFVPSIIKKDCSTIITVPFKNLDVAVTGAPKDELGSALPTITGSGLSIKFNEAATPTTCVGSVCYFTDSTKLAAKQFAQDKALCNLYEDNKEGTYVLIDPTNHVYAHPILGWQFNVKSGESYPNMYIDITRADNKILNTVGSVKVYDGNKNMTPTGSIIFSTNKRNDVTIPYSGNAIVDLGLADDEVVTSIRTTVDNLTSITADSAISMDMYLRNGNATSDTYPDLTITDGYGAKTSNENKVDITLTYSPVDGTSYTVYTGSSSDPNLGNSASFYMPEDQISVRSSTQISDNFIDSVKAVENGFNEIIGFSYRTTNITKDYVNGKFTMDPNDVTLFKAVNAVLITNNVSAGKLRYQVDGGTWREVAVPAQNTAIIPLNLTGTEVATDFELVFPDLQTNRDSTVPTYNELDVVLGRTTLLGNALPDGTTIDPKNSYTMKVTFTADNLDTSKMFSASTEDACALSTTANTTTAPSATLATYDIPDIAGDKVMYFETQVSGVTLKDSTKGDLLLNDQDRVSNGAQLKVEHTPIVDWQQVRPTVESDQSNLLQNVQLTNPKLYYLVESNFEYVDGSLTFATPSGATKTPTVNYYTGVKIVVGSETYNVLEIVFDGQSAGSTYDEVVPYDEFNAGSLGSVSFAVTTSYTLKPSSTSKYQVVAGSYVDVGYNISTDPGVRVYTHDTTKYKSPNAYGLNNPAATGFNTMANVAAAGSNQLLSLGGSGTVKIDEKKEIGVRNIIVTTTQRTYNATGAEQTIFNHEITILPDMNTINEMYLYVPIPRIGTNTNTVVPSTNQWDATIPYAIPAAVDLANSAVSYNNSQVEITYGSDSATHNFDASDTGWGGYQADATWVRIHIPSLTSDMYPVVTIPMVYKDNTGTTSDTITPAGITDHVNVTYQYLMAGTTNLSGEKKASDLSMTVKTLNITGFAWIDGDNSQAKDSADDAPFGGITVTLCKSQNNPCPVADVVAQTTTATDGSYKITPDTAGTYYVVFEDKYNGYDYPNKYDFVTKEFAGTSALLNSKVSREKDNTFGTVQVQLTNGNADNINAGYFLVRPDGSNPILGPVLTWEGETVNNINYYNPLGLTINYRPETLTAPAGSGATGTIATTGRTNTTINGNTVTVPTVTGAKRTDTFTSTNKYLEGTFAWDGSGADLEPATTGSYGASNGIFTTLQGSAFTEIQAVTTRGGSYFYSDGLGGTVYAYYPIIVMPKYTVTYVSDSHGSIASTKSYYADQDPAVTAEPYVEVIKATGTSADVPQQIPETKTPASTYEFAGWYIDANNNGQKDDAEPLLTDAQVAATVITQNTTFTALFRQQTRNVVFDAKEGTFSSFTAPDTNKIKTITVVIGDAWSTVTVPADPTPATGYDFVGWKQVAPTGATVKADGTTDFPAAATAITVDYRFEAVYRLSERTVVFDAMAGTFDSFTAPDTNKIKTITATYGDAWSTITVPADPTPVIGYDFVGWKQVTPTGATVKADGTTDFPTAATTITVNYRFEAVYKQSQRTVVFDAMAGTFGTFTAPDTNKIKTITVTYGDAWSTVTVPADPTPVIGYDFVGWKQVAPTGATVKADGTTDFPAAATTITVNYRFEAVYKQSERTVVFDAKEGSFAKFTDPDTDKIKTQTVIYGDLWSTVTIPDDPEPVKGYDFVGWRQVNARARFVYHPDGTSDFPDPDFAIISNLRFEAVYALRQYTVQYVSNSEGSLTDPSGLLTNNGNGSFSETGIDYGDTTTGAPVVTPKTTCYQFAGWYYDHDNNPATPEVAWNASNKLGIDTDYDTLVVVLNAHYDYICEVNPPRTCQDDGFPDGYYWSEEAQACITGGIGVTPGFRAPTTGVE